MAKKGNLGNALALLSIGAVIGFLLSPAKNGVNVNVDVVNSSGEAKAKVRAHVSPVPLTKIDGSKL